MTKNEIQAKIDQTYVDEDCIADNRAELLNALNALNKPTKPPAVTYKVGDLFKEGYDRARLVELTWRSREVALIMTNGAFAWMRYSSSSAIVKDIKKITRSELNKMSCLNWTKVDEN